MTSTNKQPQEDYLDLVFEDRHKDYGAYQMRRKHDRFMGYGFGISFLLIIIGIGLPLWMKHMKDNSTDTITVQHTKVVGYSQLTAPPPIESKPKPIENKPKPKITKPKVIASKKFIKPEVKPDEEVEDEEIPTQEELKNVNPGTKTIEGDPVGSVDLEEYEEAVVEVDFDPNAVEEPLPPPPPEPEVEKTPPPKENVVYEFVENPPQFPGGVQPLLKFLAENLKYPLMAQENGIEGTVVIKMVIEADGSITSPEVMRAIGGGCEEEALRVVGLMPKWQPGIQNGYPVRVKVALPVRFKLITD